jgi:YNFM family putative membrane transporter
MFGADVSEAKRVNEETVFGGLGDRLLGGWIHPPLYWRYGFVSASILILVATFSALRGLPRTPVVVGQREKSIRFFVLLER